MTDVEKAELRRQIQNRQDRRRMRRLAPQPPPEEPVRVVVQGEDDWEEAIRRERLSLLAYHATATLPRGSGSASSGSTEPILEERIVHVEHASFASPYIVTTRRSDGAVLQRDIRTGRTRLLVSEKGFTPVTGEDDESEEPGQDPTVSAINVGTVKGDHSEDHYCMLDSGANVMVNSMEGRNEGRSHNVCLGGR